MTLSFNFGRKRSLDLKRLKPALVGLDDAMLKGADLEPEALTTLVQMRDMPADLQARAAKETGRVSGHVMLTLLRRGTVHWKAADSALDSLRDAGVKDGLALDLLAYLTTARRLATCIEEAGLTKATPRDWAPVHGALERELETAQQEFPQARSLDILKGCILSLSDREAARDAFDRATSDGPAFMATSVFDQGAHTYLSETEVEAGAADVLTADWGDRFARALADRPDGLSEPRANLLCSVDAGFLSIYGPYWFNLAPYLMREGLGVVFTVIGEPTQTAAAIDAARDLIERTARFKGFRDAAAYARAFTFVPIPMPPNVGEAKTFFASARYLAARVLMNATNAPVMVLDADFTTKTSVGDYVDRLWRHEVGLSRSIGLPALWPWRRNMAGVGWFKPSSLAAEVLKLAGDYMACGLRRDPSWTLDQNALTYALERAQGRSIVDLMTVPRPFDQDRIRSLFEQTWRDETG